ncbi:LysR substrate-binding domain-containing protein [Chitiniphilus eburneus]|nr:LysR substrate-binding domain-containing protein [Chitiniphilus eburneus]
MKIHQLIALSTISKVSSIRAAARTLGLSQPAVTKAVRELESSLGHSLLERSHRGSQLTEAGRLVAQRAGYIVAELQSLEVEVAQLYSGSLPRVAVGMAPYVTRGLFPQVVERLHARYPEASIVANEGLLHDSLRQLREGEIDFCINGLINLEQGSEFELEPMFQIPWQVVARRDHPGVQETSLEGLRQYNWTAAGGCGDSAALLETAFGSTQQSPPEHVVHCVSYGAAKGLILHANYLCLLPCRDDTDLHPEMCVIPVIEPLPKLQFAMISLSGRPRTPFMAEAMQEFRLECRRFG